MSQGRRRSSKDLLISLNVGVLAVSVCLHCLHGQREGHSAPFN